MDSQFASRSYSAFKSLEVCGYVAREALSSASGIECKVSRLVAKLTDGTSRGSLVLPRGLSPSSISAVQEVLWTQAVCIASRIREALEGSKARELAANFVGLSVLVARLQG